MKQCLFLLNVLFVSGCYQTFPIKTHIYKPTPVPVVQDSFYRERRMQREIGQMARDIRGIAQSRGYERKIFRR